MKKAAGRQSSLSSTSSATSYDVERQQGEVMASGLEGNWGWSTPAGRERAARRADFLIRAAGLTPGVTCLEVGCGTGEFTQRLLTSGCTVVALELSEATAAVCRDRVRDRAEVVVGNAETGEGLEGRAFDAIVGVSVLHHMNLPLVFKNTLSTLRPGGRYAFSEPNMANPQVWAERTLTPLRKIR